MKSAKLKNKLLLSMLLTCTLIVLTVSFYQGYLRLERQKQQIQQEFISFENGAMNSIREAVWLYDWDMVQTIVENQTSKVITYAEICDRSAARCFKFGLRDNVPFLEHTSNISHRQPATRNQVDIGTVYLQAHYEPFSVSILRDLPELLLANGVSVFGVAVILFFLFHRQVVNRLQQVESYARAIDLNNIDRLSPLKVPENHYRDDEIDHLVDAINGMTAQIKDDLEQRQQLEQRLTQAQKMEALGTLAGGIAHDFNNILSAVLGFAQLSYTRCEPGSKLQQYQQQIIQAGDRAKKLIGQILLFSRRAEPVREALNLAEIIRDDTPLLRASLPTNVDIAISLDDEVRVLGDVTQLHQVVMNLTANAGYAMRETGGHLTIDLARKKLAGVAAERLDLAPGRYARLTIRDTGPGIPEAIRKRVFEPFFSTKKVGEGTGMGLAVAHGIIRAHGGVIDLAGEAGEGACFYIYLPETDLCVKKKIPPVTTLTGGGQSIVIVDDELPVAELGREILVNLGYRVAVYNDPYQAYQDLSVADMAIDLLITDLTMPGMGGLDLAKKLRSRNLSWPILLWTGFADKAEAGDLSGAAISRVLRKPFTIESLAEAVHQGLSRKSGGPA